MEQTKGLICTCDSRNENHYLSLLSFGNFDWGPVYVTTSFLVRLRCSSMSITTPVSLLANEFDVQNVLHGQVRLAAVDQICVIDEAMNGCKNLKIH